MPSIVHPWKVLNYDGVPQESKSGGGLFTSIMLYKREGNTGDVPVKTKLLNGENIFNHNLWSAWSETKDNK